MNDRSTVWPVYPDPDPKADINLTFFREIDVGQIDWRTKCTQQIYLSLQIWSPVDSLTQPL